MKSIKLFLSLASLLMLCSCSTSYYASYSVDLSKVECPSNAKQQFGETKVVSYKEGDINKYRYEDDFIEIVWFVTTKNFNFRLKNKSNHPIKVNWDDISYVDYNGRTGRVMHAGVKYNERNNSQPATTVPKGATIDDVLIPTDNVYFVSGGMYSESGWKQALLIPSIYKKKAYFASGAKTYVGKTMKILMPIKIENVQNDYTFEFTISSLLNPELGN